MNHFTDGQYAAYVGIDWADTKHDVCLQAAGCERKNTFEALMEAAKACSLGTMSHSLYDVGVYWQVKSLELVESAHEYIQTAQIPS